MRGAAAVFVVEFQFHSDGVADFGVRGLADVAMEVKIKATITAWHHVDAPGFFRLAIDADADGEGFSPAFLDLGGARCTDEHVGIDVVDFNGGAKL